MDLLEHVDPALARSPRLLVYASALQLAIIGLDVATMAAMLHALGASIAPAGVFASVVLANLFRSIGILPGGLGSFEAAAVLTLKAFGVPLATALAATLLFRGFSFWLPMLPGLWCSQRMFTAVPRGPMITHAWPASQPGCDKPMAPL